MRAYLSELSADQPSNKALGVSSYFSVAVALGNKHLPEYGVQWFVMVNL